MNFIFDVMRLCFLKYIIMLTVINTSILGTLSIHPHRSLRIPFVTRSQQSVSAHLRLAIQRDPL